MKYSIVCFIGVVLTGCSHWQSNKLLVLNEDWFKLGCEDALRGYSKGWRDNYYLINGGSPENYNMRLYHAGYRQGYSHRIKWVSLQEYDQQQLPCQSQDKKRVEKTELQVVETQYSR